MTTARVLRNTSSTLEQTFSVDGTPTDVTGSVTVTITKADGTVFATGTATKPPSTTGIYQFAIAPQANLNFLTVAWSGVIGGQTQVLTSQVEIVGMHLVTESQVRAFDGGVMADTTAYTDAAISDARTRVTDHLEQATGISWVPRYARARLDGSYSNELQLPHRRLLRVLSLSLDGAAFGAAALTDLEPYPSGQLVRKTLGYFTRGYRNVVVEYEHGWDHIVDGIDRIALLWIRNLLVESNVSASTTLVSDSAGNTYRRSQGPSGISEVDDWIAEHRYDGLDYGTLQISSSVR